MTKNDALVQAPKLQDAEYRIFLEMDDEWFLQTCFLELLKFKK